MKYIDPQTFEVKLATCNGEVYKDKPGVDVGFYYAPYIPLNSLAPSSEVFEARNKQLKKKERSSMINFKTRYGIIELTEEEKKGQIIDGIYHPYIPLQYVSVIKKEEKMDISSEEFNRTIKEYYDNFSEHWDKALNAYEKLVVSLGLPETPISERKEGRWFEENAECCGEIPSRMAPMDSWAGEEPNEVPAGTLIEKLPDPFIHGCGPKCDCPGEDPNMNIVNEVDIVISDFIRDTFNYYGASNLFAPITYYHRFYTELCNLLVTGEATDIDPKKELNDIMANEAKWKKAEREKREKSEPLWNALKVS